MIETIRAALADGSKRFTRAGIMNVRTVRRFVRGEDGAAAVEFAMVILMSGCAGIQRTSSDSEPAAATNTLHLHFIHQFEVKSALANRAVVTLG